MLLSVRKIAKHFPVQYGFWGKPAAFVKAVDGVSFDLDRGETVGVVGESGCGKSTLGRCVVGLYEPTNGSVIWNDLETGKIPEDRRQDYQRKYQMVFQNPFASLNPRQTIREILLEPMEVHDLLKPAERIEFVKDLLGQMGLSGQDLPKYPHEFSGGQRQRIGLARAMACQPDLIVLDEPVSSLDVSVQASILNLLSHLNRNKKIAYLFISHDLQVVGYLSRRLLVMYLGRVVEEGEAGDVLSRPRHPYTQVLLASSEGRGAKIEGEPPNPAHAPLGCPFHPRCVHAEDRCRSENQQLLNDGKGWKVACWKWDRI